MRRRIFALGLASALFASAQQDDDTLPRSPLSSRGDGHPDDHLPNGKSRADAVAAEEHKKALEEADELIRMSQDLRRQIADAGKFVVPIQAVRKTEDIEKLAKKIRSRLKD